MFAFHGDQVSHLVSFDGSWFFEPELPARWKTSDLNGVAPGDLSAVIHDFRVDLAIGELNEIAPGSLSVYCVVIVDVQRARKSRLNVEDHFSRRHGNDDALRHRIFGACHLKVLKGHSVN